MNRLEATLMAPIGAATLDDDARVVESPGWYQIVSPSSKEASANEVILSRVPKSEVSFRIAEVFSTYQRHGTPFKWCIGPMSTPEFEPLIKEKAESTWTYRGMAVTTDLNLQIPKDVSIERVTQSNFEEFVGVFLKGLNLQKFAQSTYKKLMAAIQADQPHRYFLAKIDGNSIGTAGTVLRNNCGYLVGSVVLEEARGRGAYRSLIQARLADLRSSGFDLAVTHARDATSAPILEKIGFDTVFNARIYQFAANQNQA